LIPDADLVTAQGVAILVKEITFWVIAPIVMDMGKKFMEPVQMQNMKPA
jgi:hypothetical protein